MHVLRGRQCVTATAIAGAILGSAVLGSGVPGPGVLGSLSHAPSSLPTGERHRAAPAPVPAVAGVARLSVSGRRLVDGHGQTVRLLGVNRPGTHYECVQTGDRIFDGPSNDASIAAIASWRATAVRVPLNEDCWLGIHGVSPAVGGEAYRSAIAGYVARLHQHGLAAIVDLQWSDGYYAGGTCQQKTGRAGAVCLKPMPDAAHAPAFWSSVAATFKNDHATVFDLFSEPFPDRMMSSRRAAWACWLKGGRFCSGFSYRAAGMRTLLRAVRRSGATNVVLVGGINYANDDSGWLAHRPIDRTGNLAASWHSYSWNACHRITCWSRQIAPVANKVPIVADEIGEDDCAHSYIGTLMPWLDRHGASYLAWAWKAADARFPCGDFNHGQAGPSLITSYRGTPTAYGAGLKNHLKSTAPTGACPTMGVSACTAAR